ncbi:hypothetical protein SI65_10046 [Aspergillus cristatus]|uniref:Uncharacterized protein n=1 Tax=Aspergillus cristatus TaxID=573508 RepID=A0A1E3B0T4_ASPCR|nr:hypothetical protein SI65_10046 [Aspergillus cristatus]
MDQDMHEASSAGAIAGSSSATENPLRVPTYEEVFPETLVADAAFRVFSYARQQAALTPPRPCSPIQPVPVSIDPQRLGEYRQLLAGLLANTLEGLALYEAQAAQDDEYDEDEEEGDYDSVEGCEGGCQLTDEEEGNDQRDSVSSVESSIETPVESSELKTEPFPDYYESCEMHPPVDIIQLEQAYNYAISKVVEEVIRFREVDPCIANPSFSSSDEEEEEPRPLLAPIEEDEAEYQSTVEQNTNDVDKPQVPNEPSSSASPPPGMYASREESDKMRVVDDMRRLLCGQYLGDGPRGVFHDFSYLIIRMGEILFVNKDSSPLHFMSAGATYDIKMIASVVTRYLAVVDARLIELLDVGSRVHYILGEVSRDMSVNFFIRYRRMLHVILGSQLRKVTPIEKTLLTTFLDLYDNFVYTSFLNTRNRQLLLEDIVNIERNEVTRILVALWDILCRVIEGYDRYLNLMETIGVEYLDPLIEQIEHYLHPIRGSEKERDIRKQLDEGFDRYREANLSTLRPEDGFFP